MMGVAACIEWQKTLGGLFDDQALDIHQTSDGGYIVAGSYSVSSNNRDYWIIKLTATGTVQWQKTLGGSGYDQATFIEQTADGGFVVAGFSGSNDGDVTGNHGDFDYWVVKLNAVGNIEWQKTLGGSNVDSAFAIHQTADGGFVVSGTSRSNNGDVSGNHGSRDIWITKLDAIGNIQWQKTLGGSADDQGWSMQLTNDGGIAVVGYTHSNDGDVSGNHGGDDFWVVKLNGTGNILWQKTLGGTSTDQGNSIMQTTDGGFVVAGHTESNDGDITGNHGIYDFWVVKLNGAGNILWQKTLGGTGTEFYPSIKQTTDGGFIVGGNSDSNDGDIIGNHGNGDVWVVKLNPAGDLVWQKPLGGSDNDSAWSINQTSDDGIILAGYSASSNGDVTENQGSNDAWLIKLATLALPACPPLLSPTPNATNVPTTTSLHWGPVTGCLDGYHLSLGTTPGGADLLNNQTVTDTFYQPAPALPAGATIYVRIVPFNSLGEASGCQEFSFMTAGTTSTGCDVVRDSMALVALYDATDGDNWTNSTNWKISGQPIGNWYGVMTNTAGCVLCLDLDGQVDCNYPNGVDYGGNNLTGNLPEAIGDLLNIEGLHLSNNNLAGTLPLSISNLSSLRDLFLYNNQFEGTIPTQYNTLSNLVNLDLYTNNLSGPIPNTLGLGSLSKLEGLYLSKNQFSGPIPSELNNLIGLRDLYIADNDLSGKIPDFNQPFLVAIILTGNKLTGLPQLQTPNLEILWLADNLLDDTIPDYNLPNLRSLGLEKNRLYGNVPKLIGTALDGMGLRENRLTFSGMAYHAATVYPEGFSYEPQDSIFSDTLIIRNPGQSLTIDLGIDANVSGNQYQWFKEGVQDGAALNSNKRSFSSLTPLNAGTYHVQVTNTAAPALTLYSRAIRIQVACAGVPMPAISGPNSLCTASAILSVSGNYPSPPQWSTGQSGASITINAPGSYSVTVTDVGGCTNSNTLVVGSAPAPNPPLINGVSALCSGTTILSVPGNYATPPQWSTGQSGNTITISSAGTYTVTVTDAGGCTNSNTKIVAATGAAFTPAISGPTALCPGAMASLVVTGNYPNLPQWSNGQAGYTTQVGPGNYTVTVTDAGGCTYTNVHQISPKPDISVQKDTVICAGQSIVFCGISFSQPDTVECTYTTSGGCDSIVTLRVSRFDPTQFSANTDIVAFSVQTSVHDFDVTANDTYTSGYVLKILQAPTQGAAEVLNNNELRYTRDTATALGLDSLQYGLCAPGNCPNTCVSAWVYLQAQSGTVDDIKALIPNVVTPNDDGVNDVFDPIKILADNGILVEKAELFIINRWGEVIHHNHDGRWEGKAPQATYYYRLRIVVAGTEYHLQGTVNLLK